MRSLVLLAALVALPAFAGESYLGKIVSGTGSDTTNGNTATPFKVPEGSKLTLYCDAAALICVDTSSACTILGGAQPGLPVLANEKLPTSTSSSNAAPTITISGATSRIIRIVGAAAVTCYVWAREGNE